MTVRKTDLIRLPSLLLLLFVLAALACRLPGSRNTAPADEAPAEEASAQEPTQAPAADTPAPEPSLLMDRYTIVQEDHPDARCNDGTTPVFYFRRGVGEGQDSWVIWFKGGGSGYSPETFQNRGPTVTSANPWMQPEFETLGSGGNQGSPDGEAGGIMSSIPDENPDFYTWNHVYLVYCSSDSWTGTRTDTAETGGIYFTGALIVDAMFDALMSESVIGSPNLSDADAVILSGSSAGANGLRANVDRLAGMLSHADVRAISDAGVFKFGFPEMENMMSTVIQEQFDVWQSRVDADCAADNADSPWLCLNGGFLVENGYIQTPMFIHQDQSDVKLQEALAASGQDVDDGLSLIGEATRALLADLEGVFSPNAGRHIIINTNRFNGFRLEGMTFAEVFGNWYFDREGPVNLVEVP